jgi:enoyl-CoA hydratase
MIEVRDEGEVRILTLANPPANALDAAVIAALGDATVDAGRDPKVRAVILRGNDRFFSGGLDLKKMAMGEAVTVASFGYSDGIGSLFGLPKPTIAEIGGHAIAGGAILALACDFRIAADAGQKIGLNETAIGLAFPPGAFEIARAGLPKRSFARAILEAELYAPRDALDMGYVHEVVPKDTLSGRCKELAKKLGAYPSGAYAHNKAMAQRPFLERCQNEPEEDVRRRTEIWTSEETLNAFIARARGLAKK